MNDLHLSGFESLAACFQSLLFVSAIGSIIVLLAIAFHMATSKWISSTWLYVFWLVVLLRFVLFAVPESPTSLLNLTAQPATGISLLESDVPGFAEDEHLIFSSDSVVPIPIDEKSASDFWSPLNFWMIAAIAWFVVVVGMMIRLGLGHLAVKRLVGQTLPPSIELNARFESLIRQLGMRLKTRLRVSRELEVPAMAGVFRPVVILPQWCCLELEDEQLEMVFTHELVHIQRRDGLIQLLAHLIVVLHWFNPLARIAASFIASARELSCDRRVIEIWKKAKRGRTQTGCDNETLLIERKYGRTILDIAGRANLANSASQFSVAFLSGFVGSNQNLIKQRIAMLVNSRSRLWLRNAVAASFVALLLAVGFTSAQTICPPSPPVVVQVESAPVPQIVESNVPFPQIVDGMLYEIPMALTPGILPDPPSPLPGSTPPGVFPLLPANPVTEQPRLYDTPVEVAKSLPQDKPILLSLNAGQVKRLTFEHDIPELMVDDPAVLTAHPVSPNEIQFTAVSPGKTEVHVYDPNRKVQVLKFSVVPDVRELKSKVEEEFPDTKVFVRGTTDGFVNVYGQVTTEQIVSINQFVIDNCSLPIRNQLSDKPSIAIKVKVYEVSKTKLKQLGVDWSKSGMDVPADIESLASLLPDGSGHTSSKTLGFGKVDGGQFDQFLAALEKHSVAKLLDQPTLVAQHGRVAEFSSGGEFPIATLNEKGQPIVEFRSYGTKIQTTPHIHSEDEMTLEIRAEVSEVAEDLGSSDGSPGFRVRRVNTGIRIKPKQTIAMIGDYRNKERKDTDATELVFLLTPRFIESVKSDAQTNNAVEQLAPGKRVLDDPEGAMALVKAALEETDRESNKKR